jgi:16S rRNA (uracil1498-N3)-methyltransferase
LKTISETSFYAPPEQIQKDILHITAQEAKHAHGVLRCAVGDVLRVVDGCGHEYQASVEQIFKDRIDCKIISSQTKTREPLVKITLAQALCRAAQFDMIVEKCTEIGAYTILPTVTERSRPLPPKDRFQKRWDRWHKIAVAAMKQSGRSVLPRIESAVPFDTLLTFARSFDTSLMAWEGEHTSGLRNILPRTSEIKSVLILVGPEAGFSTEEVDKAQAAGFRSFSIGPRRLRTETAGIVCVSLVLYELEELKPRSDTSNIS